VNRTVASTLRRTAGGGIVFALGLGAIASPARQVVPVAAASSTPIAMPAGEINPHPGARPRLILYQQMAPAAPTPAPTSLPAAPSGPAVAAVPRTAIARPAVAPRRVAAGGSSAFAYGYCTWYVAHRRSIPWHGNAAQWWWNARPYGFAEGGTPQPGAVMVMGVSGTSPEGHVGYVESVNANGSFVVSEMNWWGVPGGGWGRVDYRTVTSMRGILGFIY